MISTAVIIFRETLEIGLILGVVLAATRTLHRRAAWISLGVFGGALGASLVALFADVLAASVSGVGQELFNAGVMFIAAIFIGWTAIWVRTSARASVQQFNQTGQAVCEGKAHGYVLSTIIGLSILREGSEIVLFLYSMHVSGQSAGEILTGATVGTLCGAAVGVLFYFGIVKLPTRLALQLTSWLLVLLVAGLASQGVGYLSAAGYLSDVSYQLWNSSWLLSEDGVVGKVLHGLIGYTARPTLIQFVVYGVACCGLFAAIAWVGMRSRRTTTSALGLIVSMMALGLAPGSAVALDTIDTPYVVEGEVGVEYSGSRTFDPLPERDGIQEHGFALEYGLTSHFMTELKAEYEKEPESDEGYEPEKVEAETRIQLFEHGEKPVDVGLLFAYSFATLGQSPDEIEAKLLLALDTGSITSFVNAGIAKEVGRFAPDEDNGPSYSILAGTYYRYSGSFQPGIEYHADLGQHTRRFDEQEHSIGPAERGRFMGNWNYQAAFVWGVSESAADNAARLMVEYEFHPWR